MQKTVTIDDFDKVSEATERRRFSIDDDFYLLDLSAANAAKFDELLQPWIEAAQPYSPTKTATKPSMTKAERDAIKEWASENNIEVSDRGRIPSDVVARYKASLEDPQHASEEQINAAIEAGEKMTEKTEETSAEASPTSSPSRRRRTS